jgi:hypothetical protein
MLPQCQVADSLTAISLVRNCSRGASEIGSGCLETHLQGSRHGRVNTGFRARRAGTSGCGQEGWFCCLMYWRRTLIGAPPTDPAKYDPDHRRFARQ